MKGFRGCLRRVLFLAVVVCLAAACSDDTDGQGSEQQCDPGEQFNRLSGQCEPRSANNGGTNNGVSNNGTTNNGGTNNGGTNNGGINNGGTNNGGTNNGGTNNGGTNNGNPDAGNNGNPDTPEGCGPGTVIGMACAPSGERLAGATVTIEGYDCDGEPYSVTTTTNSDGEYTFEDVPAGQHTLTISSGSFQRDQPIIVQTGRTLNLRESNKVCLDGENVEIAVIEGAYDHVAGVLDDLQLEYDVKGDDMPANFINPNGRYEDSRDFLLDSNALNQYDILFINCGELWNQLELNNPNTVSSIIANLKAYVENGNSLYAADWSHPFIERIYADAVDYYGNDANINEARVGYAPQTIVADVSSSQMQNVLGQTQATIEFPHDPPDTINTHWVVAEGAGASSTIHLAGDAELCTSHFDGSSQCRQGGGTQPDAPLLVTYKAQAGGTVIYTAFHNERQHAVNADTEAILKFLIFQL